jgi:putative cell wall-binding protein
VLLDADGAFVYVPEAGFVGTDTFTYTVTDGYERSIPGTVTIDVVNVAPVAVDDAYETPANTTLMEVAPGVLGNDIAGDDDQLSAALVSPADHGTVFLAADGSFGYVPDTDFVGTDVFEYVATDGLQVSAPAQVTISVTPPEEPPPADSIVRVWGEDRYETNVEASLRAFADGADTVVIATGANWPDALGGSALAGVVDGPLLLTARDTLPAGVKAEIVRLGATEAYVLGGTAAVGEGVEAELADLLGEANVSRLEGADRYATARAVADEVIGLLGSAYDGTALVATGGNFPDALAASPLAAAKGWPVLLAHPVSGALYLPPETSSAIILGGTSAVSGGVQTALVAELGESEVERVGGANRYDTAALVAARGVAASLVWDGVGVATGENFPDALSAGAMLGALDTVMLLTPGATLHEAAASALATHKSEIHTVHIMGGAVAVSGQVEAAIAGVLDF